MREYIKVQFDLLRPRASQFERLPKSPERHVERRAIRLNSRQHLRWPITRIIRQRRQFDRRDCGPLEICSESRQIVTRSGAMAVAGQQMVKPGLAGEEDKINRPALRPHRSYGQGWAVLILNQEQNLTRANLAFHRYHQIGRGLGFAGDAVNRPLRQWLL